MQRNLLTPQSLHGCLILLSFLLLQDYERSLSIGRLQNLVCFNINGLSIDNKNSVTSKAHLFHMSEIPILLSLPCKVFNLWYSNIFSNFNRPTSLKGGGGDPIARLTNGVNNNLALSSKVTVSGRWVLEQPTIVFDVPSLDDSDTRQVKLTSLHVSSK